MNTLSFDLGVNEYQLAEGCIVRFNPSDTDFIKRLYDAIEAYGNEYDKYSKKIAPMTDGREILTEIGVADKSMREIIDSVFGIPVCDKVFGTMHLTARSSNGVPVGMEFFMAIIDQCDIDVTSIAGKGKAYVDKYTKKYMAKYNK